MATTDYYDLNEPPVHWRRATTLTPQADAMPLASRLAGITPLLRGTPMNDDNDPITVAKQTEGDIDANSVAEMIEIWRRRETNQIVEEMEVVHPDPQPLAEPAEDEENPDVRPPDWFIDWTPLTGGVPSALAKPVR